MTRPLVLDTSAILSGIDLPTGRRAAAPDSVRSEIEEGGPTYRRFDLMQQAGLDLMRAGAEAYQTARDAAKRTGDSMKLSSVDVDVLALAVELDAEIATDDYAIQNVASELGLPVRSIHERGIRSQWKWVAACSGCGRRFDDVPAGEECPVCGSRVRARRAG